MARPQPGILNPAHAFSQVRIYSVRDIPMNAMSVGQFSAMIPGLGHQLLKNYPDQRCAATIGFGPMFWTLSWHGQQPRQLRAFDEMEHEDHLFPETEGDVMVCLNSTSREWIDELTGHIDQNLKSLVDLEDHVSAENLPDESTEVPDIFLENDEPDFVRGCFLLVQKFVDSKENAALTRLPVRQGQETLDLKGKILARQMRFEGEKESGTLLCLFHKNPTAEEELLSFLLEDEKIESKTWKEHLKAVSGARFFVPSLDVLTGLRQGGIRMNKFSTTQQWKD